jgi:hypothetical protein
VAIKIPALKVPSTNPLRLSAERVARSVKATVKILIGKGVLPSPPSQTPPAQLENAKPPRDEGQRRNSQPFGSWVLAIVVAVLVSAPVVAQTQSSPSDRAAAKEQRAARAKERCTLNHGVDCDTPEGLKEWLLQERSRQEAVRDGSRRRLPAQPRSTTSQP